MFFCPPFRFHRNRKDGRPLRFQRNLRGRPFLRFRWKEKFSIFPSFAFFPIFSPTPKESEKIRLFSDISPDSWPFFPVGKKGRIFYYSDIFPDSEGVRKKRTLVCRRKSLAIFDGRRGSPENSWNFRGTAEKGPGKRAKKSEETTGIRKNPFIQTARHGNLINGFAGACLRRIREIRDRSEKSMKRKNCLGVPPKQFFLFMLFFKRS